MGPFLVNDVRGRMMAKYIKLNSRERQGGARRRRGGLAVTASRRTGCGVGSLVGVCDAIFGTKRHVLSHPAIQE